MSPIDLAQEGPGIITQDDRGNTYLDGVWTGGPDNPENPQPKSSQPKLGSNVDPNNPAVKQLIENPKGSQTTTPPPVPPAPLTAPPSVASSEPTKPATGAPPSVASSGPTTTTTSPSSAKAGLDKALKAADKLDKQAKDKGLDLPGIDNVLEHVPGGKHLNPAREVINTGKDFLRNIQKTPEERKEWGKQQMEEKAKPVTDALKGIREKATQPGGFMNPQQQQLEDMDLKMPTDNN
ncbi:MAG: hypothetical protein HY913_08415 [Desulfomonile tiedjei]|nr:hypothetical protein [Desulfomonile tiedjei]